MIAAQKIQDWGNSKGIRLPKKMLAARPWQGVTDVTVSTAGNKIILTPTTPSDSPTLDELLAAMTPENLHQAVDFGQPVGKELL
ncbi:MAG TPA: hypothetical protein VH234_02455 [Candidatus Saccharimonadales bacterium]|jgi:antitoxin MazE|nr:hypothetical protein [Candidatus Saccharimonadales bacterium]